MKDFYYWLLNEETGKFSIKMSLDLIYGNTSGHNDVQPREISLALKVDK